MGYEIKLTKLEDNPAWKMINSVIGRVYELVGDLPDDEKWGLSYKLRARSVDASMGMSEAVGSIDPRDILHYLGSARRAIFSVKSLLIVANSTGKLGVDSKLLVEINKIIDHIDEQIPPTQRAIPEYLEIFGSGDEK